LLKILGNVEYAMQDASNQGKLEVKGTFSIYGTKLSSTNGVNFV